MSHGERMFNEDQEDYMVYRPRNTTSGDETVSDEPLLPFSEVNHRRCVSTDGFGHALESWSVAEWTNAIAGEVGEACNIAKKLLRHRDGVRGNYKAGDQDVIVLKRRVAEELADAVIYIDLTMRSLGFHTENMVREVFNQKSKELNAPYYADAGPLARPAAEPGLRAAAQNTDRELWRDPNDLLDVYDRAFGIIANASGGDWSKESAEWQKAAAAFRDAYHETLDRRRTMVARPAAEPGLRAAAQRLLDKLGSMGGGFNGILGEELKALRAALAATEEP